MKNIAIIGLGVISQYYKRAIEQSGQFNIVAVSDLSKKAVSANLYAKYPFFFNYVEMIQKIKPDYVLISTPPDTHFEIAKTCLELGVNVLIEKPAVTNIEHFDFLVNSANQNNLSFKVMFHWQFGSEILAFNDNFNSAKVQEVEIKVLDAYSSDGKIIMPYARRLKGAWIDSGVNALSVLNSWLPFKNVIIKDKRQILCEESGLPIYFFIELIVDGVKVKITVDWRKQINKKIMHLIYDGQEMVIDNSRQRIEFKDNVWDYDNMNRLESHYYNFFKRFDCAYSNVNSRRVHEILLMVRDYEKLFEENNP